MNKINRTVENGNGIMEHTSDIFQVFYFYVNWELYLLYDLLEIVK